MERHNLVKAYYRRLTGDDSEVGIIVLQQNVEVWLISAGTDEMCSCMELLGVSTIKANS